MVPAARQGPESQSGCLSLVVYPWEHGDLGIRLRIGANSLNPEP